MGRFKVYAGNKAEKLVEQLAENIKNSPCSPFEKELVIVQNKGMERWLRLETARCNGICANLEFPFPKSFIFKTFRDTVELADENPFEPDTLLWSVFKILPSFLNDPDFKALSDYVYGEKYELKLFQLAEKIAYLFDQYLVYRPDIILEWDKGDTKNSQWFKHVRWQMKLWRAISVDRGCHTMHTPFLMKHFMEEIGAGRQPSNLPERVSVFGISTLPPLFMDFFIALSELTDIDFYYLNPCSQYWKDIYSEKSRARLSEFKSGEECFYYETGNSLLASMGVTGREFFGLVMDRTEDFDVDLFEEPRNSGLLSCIQSDILTLTDRGSPDDLLSCPAPLKEKDKSLTVHSCHSPLRELEVLHDNLLELFDEKSSLRPGDIVVMIPDIATYTPYIEAVFGVTENEKSRIPYSIADKNLMQKSDAANVFLTLLKSGDSRFKAPEVLDILEAEPVKRKFGLTEDCMEKIRTWLIGSGVRWGKNSKHKEELALPAYSENTWDFGIKRMLLGYAINGEDFFSDILPYDMIEGDNALVMGRFLKFYRTLESFSENMNRKRDLEEWSAFLNRLLDSFFSDDDEFAPDVQSIRDFISESALAAVTENAGFSGEISHELMHHYFSTRLKEALLSSGFINGAVTFCTLMPMRSIPFKVVCLLGMGDGKYPRDSLRLGFNMMEERRRPCDRSRRHEERYLFLEALLSARENFIISYVGQDIKDNSIIPPSVLVSELLDYADRGFYMPEKDRSVSESISYKHPLQAFSQKYFLPDSRFFSYSKENCSGAEALQGQELALQPMFRESLPAPGEPFDTVELDQLINFFRNPSKYLIERRLNTRIRLFEDDILEEDEIFEADFLQKFKLKQELLESTLSGTPNEECFKKMTASGVLPHGPMAEVLFRELEAELAPLVSLIRKHTCGAKRNTENLRLTFPSGIVLTGTLDSVYPAGQVFYRPGTLKAKYSLESWLRHLFIQCAEDCKTVSLGVDKGISYKELERPQEKLQLYIDLFIQGLSKPLCFFPDTSYDFVERVEKGTSEDEAFHMAIGQKWNKANYKNAAPKESEDPYFRACFGSEPGDFAEFSKTARLIYENMLSNGEEFKL